MPIRAGYHAAITGHHITQLHYVSQPSLPMQRSHGTLRSHTKEDGTKGSGELYTIRIHVAEL